MYCQVCLMDFLVSQESCPLLDSISGACWPTSDSSTLCSSCSSASFSMCSSSSVLSHIMSEIDFDLDSHSSTPYGLITPSIRGSSFPCSFFCLCEVNKFKIISRQTGCKVNKEETRKLSMSLWVSSIHWPWKTHGWESQEENGSKEGGEERGSAALWFEANWSVVSRQRAKEESDGGA